MECVELSKDSNLEEVPAAKRRKVAEREPPGWEEPCNALVPLAEVFSVHKAIRKNLVELHKGIRDLTIESTEQVYGAVDARLAFLRRMLQRHCESEDVVLSPALSAKMTDGSKETSVLARRFLTELHDKHEDMDLHFDAVAEALSTLKDRSSCKGKPGVDMEGLLSKLKDVKARSLLDAVVAHLDYEEATLLPLFGEVFSVAEQGELLVNILLVMFAAPLLQWTVRALSERERIDFLRLVEKYSNQEQLAEIAGHIAHDLPCAEWRTLCTILPAFETAAKTKATPLIEITHIHKAIRHELDDLVKFCRNLDASDDAQLQSLCLRFNFLRSVHMFHSAGEDQVILKELEQRIYSAQDATPHLHEQHDDEAELFSMLSTKVEEMIAVRNDKEGGRSTEKLALVKMMDSFAQHLYEHMDDEEKNILPLVQQHFSIEDQDQLVRRAMAKVPSEFLAELTHWCLAALSIDEQEMLLRNVLRTSPKDEFRNIAVAVAGSVQKGEKPRSEWDELCLRIPELQAKSNGAAERTAFSENSPINEILRVHKAIRLELQGILDACTELSGFSNPNAVSSLAERCSFLGRMVYFHSKAEDSIVLPLVEERVANVSKPYEEEHSDERRLFAQLAKKLEILQCNSDDETAMSVYVLARTLRDEMLHHLKMEESHLWPLLVENLSIEEQSEVISMIFGHMPAEVLQEMLPWMIRVLSAAERDEMMGQIFAVTGSTLFEKWLQTWFPSKAKAKDEPKGEGSGGAAGGSEESAALALVLLQGKEDVQRAVRLVAADSSLSPEQKSRLMQSLLVARWMKHNPAEAAHKTVPAEDRVPSYIYLEDNTKVYGCRHYQRRCKIRAKCCSRLFTCRLCHDRDSNHTMNRYQTEEVWCMECDELQPVAAACRKCKTRFARYYCSVCRLYEESDQRSIYHCHSCNVCRVGKGLGVDFFHCMRCNACISMMRKVHRCIEKVMESNCPICNHYIFSSTNPIHYLSCGHLMHRQCYDQYAKHYSRCPICQKSLEDMRSHVDRLNVTVAREPMPAEYRAVRAQVRCNDCHRESSVPFHFFHLRCGHCESLNTQMLHVDPSGGDPHMTKTAS